MIISSMVISYTTEQPFAPYFRHHTSPTTFFMKNILFVSALLTLAPVAAFASTFKGTPPQAVLQAFQKAFPNAEDVEWEMEDNQYEAEFEQGDVEQSATFSAAGQLLETETEIAVGELPAAVRDYVAANFKGKKIKEAARIVTPSGTVTYEAEVKRRDLMFDASGKFLN